MVSEAVERSSLKDNRSRSIAAAFLMAAGGDVHIKLSKEEREIADYLVPFAKSVIAADGKRYADSMGTLLTAGGASEKLS